MCFFWGGGFLAARTLDEARGWGWLFRFQNARSPKYSAVWLWQRTVAAPNSPWLTPEAKGCRLASPLGF